MWVRLRKVSRESVSGSLGVFRLRTINDKSDSQRWWIMMAQEDVSCSDPVNRKYLCGPKAEIRFLFCRPKEELPLTKYICCRPQAEEPAAPHHAQYSVPPGHQQLWRVSHRRRRTAAGRRLRLGRALLGRGRPSPDRDELPLHISPTSPVCLTRDGGTTRLFLSHPPLTLDGGQDAGRARQQTTLFRRPHTCREYRYYTTLFFLVK